MENTIVKETIIKEKSTLLYYFYCYCEKCYWKRNGMVYLWIQEGQQERHNNNHKGARVELPQQVGALYLHFCFCNVDFTNLLNSDFLHLWVKPQRERIKWNKQEI